MRQQRLGRGANSLLPSDIFLWIVSEGVTWNTQSGQVIRENFNDVTKKFTHVRSLHGTHTPEEGPTITSESRDIISYYTTRMPTE